MFTIANIAQPESLEEAYRILTQRRNNVILGGCAFLRMGSMAIGTGIDLSKLNLQYIKNEADCIEIGAMTPLRELETNLQLQQFYSGILPKAVANIIGVQFRNAATIGASVFSRYGFSDIITALAALDAHVELYKGGQMPLVQFLNNPFEKDILSKVLIKLDDRTAAYQSLRKSASDYPVLTTAVSRSGDNWTVVVGARPNVAAVASNASRVLSESCVDNAVVECAAAEAAQELSFGSNMRGSAEYRRAMCRVLVKRAITEVLSCKSS